LLHSGVFLLLQRDRKIRPEVVQRYREPTNIDDVFSFAADRLGEGFKMSFAKLLVSV
jgi:hypothetical protein